MRRRKGSETVVKDAALRRAANALKKAGKHGEASRLTNRLPEKHKR